MPESGAGGRPAGRFVGKRSWNTTLPALQVSFYTINIIADLNNEHGDAPEPLTDLGFAPLWWG